MVVPWIKVLTSVIETEKWMDLSNDEKASLIETWCIANRQSERGKFSSQRQLAKLLGPNGDYVAALIKNKWLEVDKSSGVVSVAEWETHQSTTSTERVARSRAVKRDVTPKAVSTVTSPAKIATANGGGEKGGAVLDKETGEFDLTGMYGPQTEDSEPWQPPPDTTPPPNVNPQAFAAMQARARFNAEHAEKPRVIEHKQTPL